MPVTAVLSRSARSAAFGFFSASLLLASAPERALAQPGTQVANVAIPAYPPNPNLNGFSVAVDCDGSLYFTYYRVATLYRVHKDGALLGTLPIAEPSGAPVTLGEISWDDTRHVLWGITDAENPGRVFTINPVNGVATYQFSGPLNVIGGLVDGIAFDPRDKTLWISPDVSTLVWHYTAAGVSLGTITPKNVSGGSLQNISGVSVGPGNSIYLGHDGQAEIVQVDKTSGSFISVLASTGARDEGLESDPVNFSPKTVVWSRSGANSITAYEIDPLTSSCLEVTPTRRATWGAVKLLYR